VSIKNLESQEFELRVFSGGTKNGNQKIVIKHRSCWQSYSIADGLALGFISYPIIKVCTGHRREIGWLTYVLAAALLL
jgi:hypothetical protein